MRVWLVNHYALPPSEAGGTRHHLLAKHLMAKGHEPVLLASGYDHMTRRHLHARSDYEFTQHEGVPYVWVPTPTYGVSPSGRLLNMVVFAARIRYGSYRRRLPRPDVIVGSSPHLFAAFAAQRLAKSVGAASVAEIRDLWPLSLVELGGLGERHPLVLAMKLVEQWVYRGSVRIIAAMPNAVEYLVTRGVSPEIVTWISNGVEIKAWPAPSVAERPLGDTFRVVYAGAHGPPNGLETLLDAARLLAEEKRDVVFDLYGSGASRAHLIGRSRMEGLANVHFRDPVPREQVGDVLRSADALVLLVRCSRLYRYGISMNKLFDYLAAGRPVLMASDAFNDPVSDASAGLTVPPEDPRALADAVVEMMSISREALDQMGQRGRDYVEANFDISILAERFSAVLEEAVARRP